MEVENISIKEYLKKEDLFFYEMAERHIDPENLFNGVQCDFDELTFDEISTLKKIVSKPSTEMIAFMFEICYKIKHDDFLDCKIIDFFKARKYIDGQIIEIVKREKKLLSSTPDPRMLKAGSMRLNIFGTLNTKIEIGQMFGFKPSDVGKWKYKDVLYIQAHNIATNEIKNNLK